MKKIAKGSFEVNPSPLPMDEVNQKIGAMRMSFEKRFVGALEATSVVSMIGMMNQELGSGAYVALEKLVGTLDGRKGSFCLQHSCAMSKGKPTQSITVVPDSGTDDLKGLSGAFTIDIVGDDHFYTLEYAFGSG
jgi:hypothetical protein